MDQPVHRHHQREQTGALAQADLRENFAQPELAPVLHPDVDRTRAAVLLGANALGVDADQIASLRGLAARALAPNALDHLRHLRVFCR